MHNIKYIPLSKINNSEQTNVTIFKIGSRFRYSGYELVLIQTSISTVCALVVHDSNRYREAIPVKDVLNISREELVKILPTNFDYVELIEY